MQEVRDRARLVAPSEIGAREIQTTVRRWEIQDVLRSTDGDPELVIDVTRGGESEVHTLRLAWDPGELEELLRRTDGDDITLRFDRSQLEQAVEDDVAAHGLREAAAVLAVAATTAAAGAGLAQARTAPAPQASGGAAAATSSAVTVSEREWPEVVGGTPAQAPVATDSDSSTGFDAGAAGAVAGGAALMIGAAAFTVRRRGGGEPQPA